ncbi:coproporphyrinogen III oxidase [Citrobacter koseri]|nr:coproporphyrinogen III oxidase [Citrobacter koseri]
MMMMRTAERGFQWRHTLQAGIETARVPLDELTLTRSN